MRPVPQGIDPNLKSFLDEVRRSVLELQQPGQPQAEFSTTFAKLPPADTYKNCRCLVTDKNAMAISSYDAGSVTWKWTRADGSAL